VPDYSFGDADPEDSWDDGDDEDTKLDILERVVVSLRDEFHRGRRDDALRLVLKLEEARQQRADRLRDIRQALEALR